MAKNRRGPRVRVAPLVAAAPVRIKKARGASEYFGSRSMYPAVRLPEDVKTNFSGHGFYRLPKFPTGASVPKNERAAFRRTFLKAYAGGTGARRAIIRVRHDDKIARNDLNRLIQVGVKKPNRVQIANIRPISNKFMAGYLKQRKGDVYKKRNNRQPLTEEQKDVLRARLINARAARKGKPGPVAAAAE